MIVDNYDQGNFFFPFKDKLGSTIDAATVPHVSGPYFRFLRLQYNFNPAGYCGIGARSA